MLLPVIAAASPAAAFAIANAEPIAYGTLGLVGGASAIKSGIENRDVGQAIQGAAMAVLGGYMLKNTASNYIATNSNVGISTRIPSTLTAEEIKAANAVNLRMQYAGVSEANAIRNRALNNIADSKAARAASNFGNSLGNSTPASNLFGRDRFTRSTQQLTEWRRSISNSDIGVKRAKFLGDGFVKADAGKWRSIDGTRQFRVKPNDYLGEHGIGRPLVPNTPHVHFEFLNTTSTGFEVTKNVHVPIR